MHVGRTDGLGEHGPEIRVAPSAKRRSVGELAVGPETALGAVAGAGLAEERDARGVGEDVVVSVRGSVDAEVGCGCGKGVGG